MAEQPDDATAAPLPTPGTDLQPGDGVEIEFDATELEEAEDAEARRHRESVARRVADAALVDELRNDYFVGPRYEALQEELWRYAVAVLSAWVHSGFIFSACARIKRPVTTNEQVRRLLHEDQEARHDLVYATIAAMAKKFRENALVGRGWSVTGGASLTTYYMNAVVLAFPNEYRRWKNEQDRWNKQFRRDWQTYDPTPDPTDDPGVVAPGNALVLHELNQLKPRERTIVALYVIDGYTYAEIAEIVGAKSDRAVEGVIYRWLQKERERRGLPPSGKRGLPPSGR